MSRSDALVTLIRRHKRNSNGFDRILFSSHDYCKQVIIRSPVFVFFKQDFSCYISNYRG